jgi:apolipoprotein N-acyltransferase
VLYAAAFPPWYLWPLGWIALVPFLHALADLRPRRAVLAGLVWGCAAIWAVAAWVAPAISFYYQQPWWFGVVFCVVGCMILWGSHYAVFAALASWMAPRVAASWRPLVLATLWVACEFGRARLVIGEPWMLLGYSLADRPLLIQVADLGGVYLLSFVVFLVNASLAELLRPARPPTRKIVRVLLPAALVVATIVAYGGYRIGWPPTGGSVVPVRIVQGNNELRTQWRRELYGDGLERYLALSQGPRPRSPRLLIWPESAVTFFLAEEPAYRGRIGRVLGALGAELVVGAPSRQAIESGGWQSFNSAFLVDEGGAVQARYDKRRLLPFAEYFPLRFLTFLRRHFDAVRDFTAGDTPVLLETRAGRAAVVICFEAIFPELVGERMRHGAEILINLSNDIWLGSWAGPAQHLQMVVLRAVENRVWVLRATTTGISAAIDPLGRVRVRSRFGTTTTLDQEVSPMRVWTVYKQFGDVFAFVCVAVTGLVLAALQREGARR